MVRYHVVSSDDGSFLAEIELANGLAEMYNTYDEFGTNFFGSLKGETLYAELHDWATAMLGIDHDDADLTDEDELEVLW